MASKAFLAWFGPRGLASLAFATIVWSEQIPEAGTVVAVTILTVGISLVVNGATARPFASRLAGRVNSSRCSDRTSDADSGLNRIPRAYSLLPSALSQFSVWPCSRVIIHGRQSAAIY